jgi:hypothetical protein
MNAGKSVLGLSCRSTKEPNSGARPDTAGPADERGPLRHLAHDYKRNGTTTLFAALNVLDGTVFGRCMQRHWDQEFIRFLRAAVPKGKAIHAGSRGDVSENRLSHIRRTDAASRAAASYGAGEREIRTHSSCELRPRGTSRWQHDQADDF